ncbi:hypothetical protein ACFPZ0_01215 [Streptomonospora nanhaiensis]|uniref:Uncharacterized protein n=1 Tax=Streptomonospora nanhaiensis TaxID=1323731 RepID=A0A853BQ25_9ACTN|nr:hypothetical protein [Streptomonospora nanhaiensis]MBX9387551.1 hypothetical protein [Streptomonospora nanhaiensis]NYI96522.1 hypothetical protein [Streptomonospora nanhaiensis]
MRAAWERASALRNIEGITGRLHVVCFTLDSRYGYPQAAAFKKEALRKGKDNISSTDFADGHNPDRRPAEVARGVREVETKRLFTFLGLVRPRAYVVAAGAGVRDFPCGLRPALREVATGRGPQQSAHRDPAAVPPVLRLGGNRTARPRRAR